MRLGENGRERGGQSGWCFKEVVAMVMIMVVAVVSCTQEQHVLTCACGV